MPGYADVGVELVGERGTVAVDVLVAEVVVRQHTVQTHILAERGVVLKADAVFGYAAARGDEAVEVDGVEEIDLL